MRGPRSRYRSRIQGAASRRRRCPTSSSGTGKRIRIRAARASGSRSCAAPWRPTAAASPSSLTKARAAASRSCCRAGATGDDPCVTRHPHRGGRRGVRVLRARCRARTPPSGAGGAPGRRGAAPRRPRGAEAYRPPDGTQEALNADGAPDNRSYPPTVVPGRRSLKRRVLIVDDDPAILEVLEMRLAAMGFDVEATSDAHAAVRSVTAGRFDLALLDLRMDPMDGIALMEQLHARQARLPVLIMTAHGTIETAVEAVQRGAFDYLTKPFVRDELRAKIGRALSSRRWARDRELLLTVGETLASPGP